MTQPIALKVTVKGPLFSKKIDAVVKAAMIDECMKEIDKRLSRPPPKKKLGMMRNPVKTRMGTGMGQDATLAFEHVESQFHSPRRTGSSWVKKNIGIIHSVARRNLKAVANRIVRELS